MSPCRAMVYASGAPLKKSACRLVALRILRRYTQGAAVVALTRGQLDVKTPYKKLLGFSSRLDLQQACPHHFAAFLKSLRQLPRFCVPMPLPEEGSRCTARNTGASRVGCGVRSMVIRRGSTFVGGSAREISTIPPLDFRSITWRGCRSCGFRLGPCC